MQPPVLKIRDLRIEGRHHLAPSGWSAIVHDINLELQAGEVLGLIGESGAGKSTIGLAAMGYAREGCRLAAGSVKLADTELVEAGGDVLRSIRGNRIVYVAQSAAAAFNPAYTLMQQVCEGPVLHGGKNRRKLRQNAQELFARMRLPSPRTFGDKYPHQVSGGQLQRAMMAMALISNPDVIVLDEPTTALDVTTQLDVLATVKAVIREVGAAAIYITHDLAVVAQLADRIMVLKNGGLVEEGTTAQIIHAPRQDYTRRLVSHRPTLDRSAQQNETVTPVLAVTNVQAAYPKGPQVLQNVSLEIRRGCTMAVVGESGSGKSTLGRVITGLLPPSGGQVRMNDIPLPPELNKRNIDQVRQVQLVHQLPDVALNPRQTIGNILKRPLATFFRLSSSKIKKRVHELLDWVELPGDFTRRYPNELSGGQKQRICIARALAAEPELIICDEVTSALDLLVADGVLELLKRLQKETGVAYLLITHDMDVVESFADEISVMYQGCIVEQNYRQSVLGAPREDYTKLLLSSVPKIEIGWMERIISERAGAS